MPDRVDDLYALPLEEFTAARDALAKELRSDGERDAAAEVKALRKPTPAAWAVNQLARAGQLDDVLSAAATLREAQEAALAGGGAKALRESAAAEREAVDEAVAAARALKPGGRAMSAATAEKVRMLLHAAARDATLAESVKAGRVVEEPAELGAWGLGEAPAAPRRATKRASAGGSRSAAPKPKPKPKSKPSGEAAAAREEAAAARKAETARRRELRDAREERTRLRRAVERAARRCSDAADAVERARATLNAAEDAADEAQAHFDEARAAAAEAEARVAELET